MKFVVYALVLANLGILGWLYQQRNVHHELRMPTTQLPTSIEPLVLLRERSKVEPAMMPPVESRAEPPEQTEAAPLTPATGTTDTASSDLAPSPAQADIADIAPVPLPAMQATAETPTRICQSIGPFPERPSADEFIANVSGAELITTVRTAHIEQPSGYWVYLPSMSRTQAQRIVRDFEEKGVKDYFLGRQNFISLGVFTDKRSAEMRSQTITALGYAPRLEPRFLSHEVYWVDLEESTDAPLNAAQWDALLTRWTGIRRQPLTCE
ncbi:MAG: hypothetical protein HY941_10405 [Gammaproteobacteria bacterium]|nr:hypothetical protein [Gammaproteobacteria bacterium]